MSGTPQNGRTDEDIQAAMKGFPPETIDALLAARRAPDGPHLDEAVRRVLEFHLPRNARRSLATVPREARLREDLGVDSLTLAEAAFKLDELLGLAIESHETSGLSTLGDLLDFLRAKAGTTVG